MITKNDCLMLLGQLSDEGIDTSEMVSRVLKSSNIDLEVLRFINGYKPMDVLDFYDKLRKNYNQKHSKLYKSIVEIDEKEPKDIVVTLSALLTQILLHSKSIQERELFLKHSRAEEISKVLTNYFKTYDLTLCISLLKIIKADLKALESLKNIHNI